MTFKEDMEISISRLEDIKNSLQDELLGRAYEDELKRILANFATCYGMTPVYNACKAVTTSCEREIMKQYQQ